MNTNFENEIWETFLKDAVITHNIQELQNYPISEIEQTPLPLHYIRVIKKLVYHYRYHILIKKAVKASQKIACIILIFMGISFSALLQFTEVRAACHNIILKICKGYNEFIYTSSEFSDSSKINLQFIPDGFFVKKETIINDSIFLVLENADGTQISLNCYQNNHTLQIDNEHYTIENVNVNNLPGTYFCPINKKFENILVWNNDKQYYILTSVLDKDVLLKIAENIESSVE